ncbi:hypothetical protein [Enterococcus sp. AZ103]|uniref:hypothetical protein n=1 Tax=Enterococcus sp. AZ103 TaxID=2774628 RepID=UPI003F251DB3
MFDLFKKKKEITSNETELTDNIPVSNLKNYVVQGYEKEKELLEDIGDKAREILRLRDSLKEFDALKVVLEKKESDIRRLETDLKLAEKYKDLNTELNDKINTLQIEKHNLLKEKAEITSSLESQFSQKLLAFSDDLLEKFSELVTNYKGNLSKQEAKDILDSLLYVKTKEVS